jgi:hypothetical protein
VEVHLYSFLTLALIRYEGSASLYPPKGKKPPVPTEVVRPQSQFGHFGEEKNLMSLPGIEPQIVQSVA